MLRIQHPLGSQVADLYYGQDALVSLQGLADHSVHTVCTSPPYWGLRDYGKEDQLGQEENLDDYIERLVAIFREVKRVLRVDGTLWLNIGDTYVTDKRRYKNLPIKSLIGVPWRVAQALQEDGWILRSNVIWSKPNPMPELARDRPTRSHEDVFLFAHPNSNSEYYYDRNAIREPCSEANVAALLKRKTMYGRSDHGGERPDLNKSRIAFVSSDLLRNKRTVWDVIPHAFSGAHFAVWPPGLVEPMVKASTSEKGYCSVCGNPWYRTVTLGDRGDWRSDHLESVDADWVASSEEDAFKPRKRVIGDWEIDCDHGGNPVPGIVLDPFSGSATTGEVAMSLGRSYVGLDLNPDYLEVAQQRITGLKAGRKKDTTSDDTALEDLLDIF